MWCDESGEASWRDPIHSARTLTAVVGYRHHEQGQSNEHMERLEEENLCSLWMEDTNDQENRGFCPSKILNYTQTVPAVLVDAMHNNREEPSDLERFKF